MENETKKRYHITITDNETGEIKCDSDSAAIIGAYDTDNNATACLCSLACDGMVLSATIMGVLQILDRVKDDNLDEYILAERVLRMHNKENE